MSLLHKSLEDVSEADLSALIAEGEPEGKTLEYKRDTVGNGNEDKKEFLYDVTSLANTLGGHLVFGIEEKAGAASELVGLQNVDPDAEILRLESIVRDGVRPPIVGLQSIAVPLRNGNSAIVLRVPKSWNPPHQVTYQKSFRFYARASNGKYQLDVDELRRVFLLSSAIAEKLKQFRVERVGKIIGDDTPVELDTTARVIIHLLPLSAFADVEVVDLHRVWRSGSLVHVLGGGGTCLFNVDGLLLASPHRPTSQYVQLFRDGCIEIVDGWSIEASRCIFHSPRFEHDIIGQVTGGKRLFQELGVPPPIMVMLTLVGMRGWPIATEWGRSAAAFDRDPILVPELLCEDFDWLPQHKLKPVFDAVWNAAGSPGSPNYDDQGRRKQGS